MKSSTTFAAVPTVFLAGLVGLFAFAGEVGAADPALPPQTKLRINVVQWIPLKGVYEQWTALSGEFAVSDAGTIVLPVIGSVSVGLSDSTSLAREISRRLQEKIGTVASADVTAEIVGFPPVYVVGDVKTPGAYEFRAGLNVLQAVALGGGELRSLAERSSEQMTLVSTLRGHDIDILRSSARIARLRAEMAGATEIDFPPKPGDPGGGALATEVFMQEKAIFVARANELDRQTKSLNELRELLNEEIRVLQQKIVAADAGIATLASELENVTALVEKGLTVASRKSDLERALAGDRSDRLDQITALMRARQRVAESTRDLEGLHDRRQTEVASELQKEQSGLEQLLLKRELTQKLLLDLLSSGTSAEDGGNTTTFSIIRQQTGVTDELPATQSTLLRPGDVVKVKSVPPLQLGVDPIAPQVSQ